MGCARHGRRLKLSRLLEAGPAKDRPALRGFEGNRGFGAALGACGAGFGAHPLLSARALGLALLAVLGVVCKLLVVEEKLLAGREYKLGAAIYALQYSIYELHGRLPKIGETY
jgi:hypothetical protein